MTIDELRKLEPADLTRAEFRALLDVAEAARDLCHVDWGQGSGEPELHTLLTELAIKRNRLTDDLAQLDAGERSQG